MALDKLTLLDETVINNSATSAATIVVNNSVQTNYISFAVATASPTSNGWRTYNDGAATSPVDGVSGTVNSTLTQNTVLPLNSTGDFRLTKNSGASRQGEGFSTDFTIANRHLGKVLQVSFDYELVSGTLATDDIRLYVIQSPSSSPVVIEPVGVSLQGTVSGTRLRHIATFQTHISITSYRLCIHIATTTNSLQVIDFNNFRVWEPTQSIGSIITDWQSYSATINGVSVSNSSYRWRRSGGSVEISGSFTFSSQSGLEFQIPLPSGLSISSIIDRKTILGKIHLAKASFDSSNPQWFLIGITGTSYLTLSLQSNNFNTLLSNFNSSGTGASSGDIFTFFASVPIAGWGSSVAMSSDSNEGREIHLLVQGSWIDSVTGSTTNLRFDSVNRTIDTHGAWNNTTGEFTAPIRGLYEVSCVIDSNQTSAGHVISMFIDGINASSSPNFQPSVVGFFYGTLGWANGSNKIFLNAGQKLSLRSSAGWSSGANGSLAIARISAGSQIMAQVETVACRYENTSGQTLGAGTIVNYSNRIFDTHAAVTVGANWIFTCPLSGKYSISVGLYGLSSNYYQLELFRNNTYNCIITSFRGDPSQGASVLVDCIAGDTLQIRSNNGSFSIQTGAGYNFISIFRIGI